MSLSKLAIRRLTKLADYMDALPPSARKHFDMRLWFQHTGSNHTHNVGKYITPELLDDCGTKACAMGWAATVPEFRKAGLRIEAIGSGDTPHMTGRRFFEMEEFDFIELFGGGLCSTVTTPKQWARHCRKFLKANA